MTKQELNDDIAQIMYQLAGALTAESGQGAKAFLERAGSYVGCAIVKLKTGPLI